MSENQKHINSELYQTCTRVYNGTRELPIKEQRGKKYVNFQGKQVNLKDIPEKFDEEFDYVFNFGFQKNPNPELSKKIIAEMRGKSEKIEIATEKVKAKLKTGEIQIFEIPKSENQREWFQKNNIQFIWFKNINI